MTCRILGSVRPLPRWTLPLLLSSLFVPAVCAQQISWQVPPELIPYDFTAKRAEQRASFADDGFAWEFPLALVMLQRDAVRIEARLGEPGRFELSLTSPDALVELSAPQIENGIGRITLTSRVPKVDRRELRKRAMAVSEKLLTAEMEAARTESTSRTPQQMARFLREIGVSVPAQPENLSDQFIRQRAVEQGQDKLRMALEQFGTQRAAWINEEDRRSWKSASPRELMTSYFRLVEWDLADQHLKSLGLNLETSRRNAESVLLEKLEAAHALLTGRTINADDLTRQLVQKLTPDETARLRAKVAVTGHVRLYPAVDALDPNAQWFHAQRVACSARGASTILVHGRLDPGRHDATDWWTLTGYAADKVALRWKSGNCRHDLFPDRDQRARLRVLADAPTDYSFEIVWLDGDRDLPPIILHESPSLPNTKFPF